MAEEFILDWKVDQPGVLAGRPAQLYALLTIKPNPAKLGPLLDLGRDNSLPAHLMVVVDVSGSMQTLIRDDPHARVVGSGTAEGEAVTYVETQVPTRLMVAQTVVQRLVERLTPADRLTLVAFDHEAHPLATCVPASQRRDLQRAVTQLAATGGGSTSLGQGLRTVLRALDGQRDDGTTRKLIVLTDGKDDEPAFALEQARLLARQHHVPIHAFGTGGSDYRGDFLKELAEATGGFLRDIGHESQAAQCFDEVLAGQKNILATNVRLAFWLAPEIFVQELYRTKPEILYFGAMRPDANQTLTVPVEYLERGRVYEFLFQCQVPAREAGRRFRIAKATLTYDLPALGLSGQKAETNIVVEYTDDAERALVRVGDVRRVVAQAEVQRQVLFLQATMDALNAGTATDKDRTTAARLLDALIKKYEEFGDQASTNLYRGMQQEFLRRGTISQEMLNRSLASSSRVEGGGLAETVDVDF